MKKLLPIVILVAALGAAAWFFLGGGPKGETPSLAGTLPAASTAGLAGAQNLDAIAKSVIDGLDKIPAEQRKGMGPAAGLGDAEQRKALIGFDPASAEGWAGIGLDPKAGIGFTVDARIMRKKEPVPVALLKVTDQAKLFAFVESKAGTKPTVDESAAPAKLLKMGDKGVLYFGERQGYTAVLIGPPRRVKDSLDGFKAFLGDASGDLAGDKAFKLGFDGAENLQIFGYLGGKGALGMVEAISKAAGLPPTVLENGKFYVDLFPGMGIWSGDQASGGRLVASEKGVEIIRKLFAPAGSPAKFSDYVPAKEYSAIRISVNLKDLFSGVGDVLPPSMSDAKSKIGMAPMALAFVGLNWDDLVAAFTGHVVISMNMGALAKAAKNPGAAMAVVLLGVGDTDKADTLVPTLLGLAGKGGMGKPGAGPKPEAVEIEGAKGHKMTVGPLTVVAVRDGKVIIAGPEAAVKAAMAAKKGEHLSHKGGVAALNGDDVIEGVYYDAESIGQAMAADLGTDGSGIAEMLKGQKFAGALRHDGDGIYWHGEGIGVAPLVGVMAAIAVPAFQRYIERSKQAERMLIKQQEEMRKLNEQIEEIKQAP